MLEQFENRLSQLLFHSKAVKISYVLKSITLPSPITSLSQTETTGLQSGYSLPTLERGHVISSVSDSRLLSGMRGVPVSLLISSLKRASSASADLKAC